MPKPHWILPDGQHGCQHTDCNQPATTQWQRLSTDEEITADLNTQGPYGDVHRNHTAPHHTAVFACNEHTLPLDQAANTHQQTCPAPDTACDCA